MKKSTLPLIAILLLPLGTLQAEQAWQVDTELLHAQGNYHDSYTMNRQRSDGLRVSGEYQKQWGLRAGLVSTTIDLNASLASPPAVHQQNWLLSSYLHL